ncbi:MAG: MFS transporter [Theionarchaea archaeon]|nr:MFS transporter [Theionarchaea archaeon]
MPLYTKNLFILLAAVLLFFSSFYILLPTLPLYVHIIGGDQKDVGLVIGVFTLSSVFFRPFVGKFTNRIGRKNLMITGAFIFFVSPFFYSFTTHVATLLLVRIFHGVGIAAFTVSSITLIADTSPIHRRGEAFGAFGLSAMIALTVSPAVGTWLLIFSFTEVFLTAAALSGVCVFLCFLVKEPRHNNTRTSFVEPGKVLLPSVIILLCTITYGSIIAFLPFFAENISGFSLFYTCYALSSIVIRIPVGRISDCMPRQRIILPGLFTVSMSLVFLYASHSLILLAFSGLLYGIGFSSVYPTLTALLVDRIPEEARAQGLSYFTASFDLGIALGSVIFGFLPLSSIYPLGSVIVFTGMLFFYWSERSNLSSSR